MELIADQYGVYGYGRYLFTVYTKDEHCKRGEYSEEIDVRADTVGKAKRIARAVLDRDYIPGLRIARVKLVY